MVEVGGVLHARRGDASRKPKVGNELVERHFAGLEEPPLEKREKGQRHVVGVCSIDSYGAVKALLTRCQVRAEDDGWN